MDWPMDWVVLPWQWWALGGVLVILEALAPGFVLIWLGAAALVTGLALWLWPSMSIAAQLVLFALVAAGTVLGWFAWRRSHPPVVAEPGLNQRGAGLIGGRFDLIEPIRNGRGKIRVGDSVWLVDGPDLPAGSPVRVTAAEGVLLRVSPEPPPA